MIPTAATRGSHYLSWLLFAGLTMIAASAAWWFIVFAKLILAGTLGIGQSVACFGTSNSLCDLALALCDGKHWLNINFYTPHLLWLGLMALSIATYGKLKNV